MNKLHLQDIPFLRDGLSGKEANTAAQSLTLEQGLSAEICSHD